MHPGALLVCSRRGILFAMSLVTCLAAGSARESVAHPHVWIEGRADVLFGPDGAITGIRQSWTFDEMYSAFASQGLDSDGDGTLSREDLQPLAELNLESVAKFGYFTSLQTLDDAEGADFEEPVDYWQDYDGLRLTLHFTLPLAEPVDPKAVKTVFDIYDPNYYVGFSLPKTDPVTLVAAPEGCRPKIGRAKALKKEIAEKLAQIPSTVRELPPDLFNLTSGNANSIRVACK